MKIIAWCILLPALLFAGLAWSEETSVPKGGRACNASGLCLVNREDLDALIAESRVNYTTSNLMQQAAAQQALEIQYLKAELAKLQAIKGCAKLEVQPKT